ncbi:hypothetical protein DYST_03564 [Dyella terrae]|nr:hypothetical protein DYST_03564 [Dyella terrae]
MLTLQINTAGSWRHVTDFAEEKLNDVLAGLKGLAQGLGADVKWSILNRAGQRQFLPDIHTGDFPGWNDVTATSPPPLVDVFVSAYDASDDVGVVMMAWRSATDPNCWVISGSEEPILMPIYAWGPVMDPQDIPAALKREAA